MNDFDKDAVITRLELKVKHYREKYELEKKKNQKLQMKLCCSKEQSEDINEAYKTSTNEEFEILEKKIESLICRNDRLNKIVASKSISNIDRDGAETKYSSDLAVMKKLFAVQEDIEASMMEEIERLQGIISSSTNSVDRTPKIESATQKNREADPPIPIKYNEALSRKLGEEIQGITSPKRVNNRVMKVVKASEEAVSKTKTLKSALEIEVDRLLSDITGAV